MRNVCSVLALILLVPSLGYALDEFGNGDRSGIQALYLFNETTGVVRDVSGVGAPLDLSVTYGNVARTAGSLSTTGAAVLRSAGHASKIINACKASNEITIEVWLRNMFEEPVFRPKPVRIVTLGRKSDNGTTHVNNFFLGQDYDAAGIYAASLRTGTASAVVESNNQRGKLLFGSSQPKQHVVFTRDRNGVARLWMSNRDGVLLLERQVSMPGNFAQWFDGANPVYLTLGSEPFFNEFPEYSAQNPNEHGAEWKYWSGTYYMVAIYCEAKTPEQLIGSAAPGTNQQPIYPVDPNDVITPERQRAQLIYRRLTGVNTPVDNPVLKSMESLIKVNDVVGAALIATREDSFFNITVRDMAARMSTREGSVNTILNDFMATLIGATRDDVPAPQLLTGNFSYRANVNLAAVPYDERADFLLSNNHYQSLEEGRFNLARVLVRVDGQKLYNGATNSVVAHPDPAGIVTSRAFMAAHAIAGTNRRLVEKTFEKFLCIPINQWADVAGTDTYVGRDVDRAPGMDINKFKTTCRSCHSVMDSFRGAFAKVDFSANYVKHADVMAGLLPPNADAAEEPEFMAQDPVGIAAKYARNNTTFSGGYTTLSTEWINNANRGLNAAYFGWPAIPQGQSTHRGFGMRSFATLVSQSQAFPRCMAIRAYRSVCKRDVTSNENALIARVAGEFVAQNYNLRELFARIAVAPECIGQ